MGLLTLTLKVDVPQVQDGRQQLENVPALVVREEQFHGRTDVLVNFSIVSALALDARPLQQVGVTAVIAATLCDTADGYCGTFVRNAYSWASPRANVSFSSAVVPASMQ